MNEVASLRYRNSTASFPPIEITSPTAIVLTSRLSTSSLPIISTVQVTSTRHRPLGRHCCVLLEPARTKCACTCALAVTARSQRKVSPSGGLILKSTSMTLFDGRPVFDCLIEMYRYRADACALMWNAQIIRRRVLRTRARCFRTILDKTFFPVTPELCKVIKKTASDYGKWKFIRFLKDSAHLIFVKSNISHARMPVQS